MFLPTPGPLVGLPVSLPYFGLPATPSSAAGRSLPASPSGAAGGSKADESDTLLKKKQDRHPHDSVAEQRAAGAEAGAAMEQKAAGAEVADAQRRLSQKSERSP